MSKFLLNLLLQISKALVNLKIQFLIQKSFFLVSAQPTGRVVFRRPKAPGRPIQPACRSRLRGKYVFLFGSRLPSRSPLPRLSVNQAPDVSFIPHLQPPELACAATDSQPPSAAQLRASGAIEPLPPCLHSPSLNFPP
jgi:hypothetical protein